MKGVRKQKELVFIDVSDGSTPAMLQVVISSDQLKRSHTESNPLDMHTVVWFQLVHTQLPGVASFPRVPVTMGCSVVARGTVVESSHSAQRVEMTASHLQLLGPCNPKV